ncbi:MAG: hypothetical protein IKB16_11730 [Lentisphaeria bacterium]|nr:hypothetical protein [Lentisphaeria bacterium]
MKGNPFNLASINANNDMYDIGDGGDYNGDGVDDVMLQNIMPKAVNGVTITLRSAFFCIHYRTQRKTAHVPYFKSNSRYLPLS